ncbi:SETD3 family histone-lysine N-methyltransferase, partial [Noviherbaspirillum denitrificans]|uniref:SETD3 family histone-lysine N-methyltransferase n=1 Tax=Noviherbaspirillum denitrificans TaxID=1968433 RepID=UPI00197CFE46
SLYASKNVAAGSHVYESYGRRCNGRLFVHHGFCLDNNDANEAEIELPALLPAHPFATYTKDLGTLNEDVRSFKVPLQYDEANTKALFSMLRLGCLEDMPGVFRTMVNGAKVNDVPPISRKNEIAALTALNGACQRRLEKFPTSIEHDEALLANGEVSDKLRYAVAVRLGEKKILRHYQELAQQAITVLQNPFCDLRDYAKADTRFGAYFQALHDNLSKSME